MSAPVTIGGCELWHGDCLDVLRGMAEASVDSVVTDPPSGIGFMSKSWDHDKGGRNYWIAWMAEAAAECLRVAKPGAHALVWALPRTSHWTATAWEDAGWEVRDRVHFLHGVGFPKGLNVVNQLIRLALWQSPEHARLAAQSSASTLVRCERAKAPIAVALAQTLPEGGLALLTEIGGEVALHVPTDTWPSRWASLIGLNTIWSWNGSLDEACSGVSKSITSTISETTTDQKTYNWLIGLHTSATITRCNVTLRNGLQWPALTAASHSSDAFLNSKSILLVSALGDASWQPLGRYVGFNVALKPAVEDWWLLRKPLAEPTIASQVLATGTGALNIDGCRVATNGEVLGRFNNAKPGEHNVNDGHPSAKPLGRMQQEASWIDNSAGKGRWPANLCHDGSPEVMAAFAEQSARMGMHSAGHDGYQGKRGRYNASSYEVASGETTLFRYGDTGTAARFFPALGFGEDEPRFHYSSKANRTDRAGSKHPTIKPQSLLKWLARLITPPGGTILDPFAGSGSLGTAALAEGFSAVLIEREAEYFEDALRRLTGVVDGDMPLFSDKVA